MKQFPKFSPVIAAGLLWFTPGAWAALETTPELELARKLNQAFIQVAEKVSPSVVVIQVINRAEEPAPYHHEDSPFFESLPPELQERFREYFSDRDMTPEERKEREQRRELRRRYLPPESLFNAQGSGIIIRQDGYILTNRHVIENAEKISVRLRGGDAYGARVQGEDLQSDLAVLKIEAENLPAAVLADSDQVRVGEFAIAIGAPFSLDYSVTFGHVSAKGRSGVIPFGSMDQDFIQTDANINPGNSGGPLVNIEGEVIGINTLIQGLNSGINFAIASNLADEVAEKLIAEGKYVRGYLGVAIATLADYPNRSLIQGVEEGVLVTAIPAGGPAAHSELKAGDVIVSVNGETVTTSGELKAAIRVKPPGESVKLGVIRNGQPVEVPASLGEWPEQFVRTRARESSPVHLEETEDAALGLTVKKLSSKTARERGLENVEGVLVTEVEPHSVSGINGDILVDDIITDINYHPVDDVKSFKKALADVDLKKGIRINLIRNRDRLFVILREIEE